MKCKLKSISLIFNRKLRDACD